MKVRYFSVNRINHRTWAMCLGPHTVSLKLPEKKITDLDLPPGDRTQANFWKIKYLEMYHEVRNANKGISRLRKKLNKKDKK